MGDGRAPAPAGGPAPRSASDLLGYLDSLGIETTTVAHEAVFTVEESQRLRGDIPGAHTKALFLRSRDGQLFLLVAAADRSPDLKSLAPSLDTGRLSLASREELLRHLGVVPGAVSPFAVVNDREGVVRVVLDRQLLSAERLNFHPLDNTQTTGVTPDGLLRFLDAVAHPPGLVDVAYA